MPAMSYPSHIKPLTSLRFVAAIWVLLYHFRDHLGFQLGGIGLVGAGYLGVDLFFTLSGFILAHVYLAEVEGGRFGYAGFLQNRIARIYPMHLAALAAMLALFGAANALGVAVGSPDAFRLSDLPQHLLMIHAWGTTPSVGWNFPSWSISAEWGAYLLFPLIAMFVLKFPIAGKRSLRQAQESACLSSSKENAPRWSFLVVFSALVLCLVSFVALDNLHRVAPWVGRDFSQMTAQIGALRILPSFLLGVALYAYGRAHAAPAWAAWPIVLSSLLWIIAVATLHLWEGLIWFGLAGLIYGLAETSRHKVDAPVAGERFVFLGAASYALYMTHLPVDIVWFHTLARFGVDASAPLALRAAALGGVFIACVIVSCFAYLWLEEPARKFVRKLQLPSFQGMRSMSPEPRGS